MYPLDPSGTRISGYHFLLEHTLKCKYSLAERSGQSGVYMQKMLVHAED